MSNVIQRITISRSSSDGSWENLHINVLLLNEERKRFQSENIPDINEDEALSDLMDNFAREFNSDIFRSKIVHEFHQMRGNDYSGGYFLIAINNFSEALYRKCIVYDEPEDQPISHFSCKKTTNEDYTKQATKENKISHSELKEKVRKLKQGQ